VVGGKMNILGLLIGVAGVTIFAFIIIWARRQVNNGLKKK